MATVEGSLIKDEFTKKYNKRQQLVPHPKRFKLTTDSKHSLPAAPDILDRRFDVQAPNTNLIADIGYVRTYEDWLYLVLVMGLCSRQIVDWATSERMKKQIILDALAMAYWQNNLLRADFINRIAACSMLAVSTNTSSITTG